MRARGTWGLAVRAALLERGVFASVAADPAATRSAVSVALTAGLVGGLGSLWPGGLDFRVSRWITTGVGTVLALGVAALVVLLLGRLFGGSASYPSVFRALGFASAPYALAVIPAIGTVVGWLWALVAAVRAVHEVEGVPVGMAAAIVLIPVGVAFLFILTVIVLAGLAAPGVF